MKKTSLRLHAVCRRGYCVFPAVAAPFGFRALSGCRPVYLLGVGHYDFQPGFSVGDHSSGSRGDGDRHVRLFGDLQRRNRCRGTRRRIRLYARFDCPDRLCRGYDRIVGGALLLGAVGAVIEKERG